MVALCIGVASHALAQEEEILPIPSEVGAGEEAPTVNEAQEPIAITPIAECQNPVRAKVYTIKALTRCGEQLPNSGLRGVINRGRSCVEEVPVAQVFASLKTCETCAVKSALERIRCQRKGCNVCEQPEYIRSLSFDLASSSRRVRTAAELSIKLCGLRVKTDIACVDQPVPSILLFH